jgi:hypothetical protein
VKAENCRGQPRAFQRYGEQLRRMTVRPMARRKLSRLRRFPVLIQ